jgi:hypothetical protein
MGRKACSVPNLIVRVREPSGRIRRYTGHNMFTDYGLFLLMYWAFGTASVPTVGNPSPSGTYGIGDGTRYTDGVNVYPSPFDGNDNSLSGPVSGQSFQSGFVGNTSGSTISLNNTASSGSVSNYQQIGVTVSNTSYTGLKYTYLLGPLAWLGAILVATNDGSSPSETSMVFGSSVYALWSNMDSSVTPSSASSWSLSGSTSSPSPPFASWTFVSSSPASTSLTIQSFAWTLPFVVGSVSAKTAPTQQTSLTTAYTNGGSGTQLSGWPIISKVLPSSGAISVPAGSKLSVTYQFQMSAA